MDQELQGDENIFYICYWRETVKIVFVLFLLTGCFSTQHGVDSKIEIPHPIMSIENWEESSYISNLESLVKKPTALLKDFVEKSIKLNKILGGEFAEDKLAAQKLRSILMRLDKHFPGCINREFKKFVRGIYIVKGLGALALSSNVWDGKSFSTGFIVVNGEKLIRGKNPLGYRLSSGFDNLNEGHFKVSYSNEEAVIYLLIHEFAHIYAAANGRLPNQYDTSRNYGHFEGCSWIRRGDEYLRKKELEGLNISFYRNKKDFAVHDEEKFIDNFLRSNFPSIYGVENLLEDWAESYAIYFMKKYFSVDYEMEVQTKNKKYKFKSCILDGRCPKKSKYIRMVVDMSCAEFEIEKS